MPDYGKLRQLVSHRVTFEYDTGVRIVGYLAGCKPASGQVQVANMTKVDLIDATGKVLEHHEDLTVVPNALVAFRLVEGPRGREV